MGGNSSPRFLLLLLTLLAACSDPESGKLDPRLFVGEGVVDQFHRYFMPETYWQERVKQLSADVETARQQFQEVNESYRALLNRRRQSVAQRVAEVKEQGGEEKKTARQQVIHSFRQELDPLREQTRQLGKAFRQRVALLEQARQEWERVGR